MTIQQRIELTIAQLERENALLTKLLQAFGTQYNEDKINEVLDLQIKNQELITKLKRGLN